MEQALTTSPNSVTGQAEALLAAGADPRGTPQVELDPLGEACHLGDISLVEQLLKYGASANGSPYHPKLLTPLERTVSLKPYPSEQYIYSTLNPLRVRPDAVNALAFGSIVRALVTHGARPFVRVSALHGVHPPPLERTLKRYKIRAEGSPHIQCLVANHTTPLLSPDMVKTLVNAKQETPGIHIDPTGLHVCCDTTLDGLACRQFLDLIDDIHAKDHRGLMAFDRLLIAGVSRDSSIFGPTPSDFIVNLFLERGARLSAHGETALSEHIFWLGYGCHFEVPELATKPTSTAQSHARSSTETGAILLCAVIQNDGLLCELLISSGVEIPDTLDKALLIKMRLGAWQETLLHRYAERGSVKFVSLFLNFGADDDATDNNHRTALPYAALRGTLDVVKILVEAGAQLALMDRQHKKAIDYAQQ
ncbi:Hypothetical protein D9617_1g088420 [Elsinoe fawcettii]|nr:Hypothetical protein D9617_1g088420 [Elsinoe fawcettii]